MRRLASLSFPIPRSPIARRLSGLVQSPIRAMTREANRLGAINLGQGICDLPTPPVVREAVIEALASPQKSSYSLPEGLAELRGAIAGKLERKNGMKADPATEIVVTAGATGAFASTLLALFNPGDGVIVFEPYYGYHLNTLVVSDLEPQVVPLALPELTLSEAALRRAVRDNTRAILVCTPANPSGKMFTEAELEMIGRVARDHDLVVLSDETYEYIQYDGRQHLSPGSLAALRDRTVSIMGLSKTFSITGWRLGYAVARRELADAIRLVNDIYYLCAPTPLQHGVIPGFAIGEGYFADMAKSYQDKRDRFCAVLDRAGLPPIVPQGAYYVLADVSRLGYERSEEAAMAVMRETGVAGVPGTAFFQGRRGERYVRFCFARAPELIDEACRRLEGFRG